MILGYFDPATLMAFMTAGLLLNLTPGADMLFTMACGVSGGPRAGMAAAAGITLGGLAHIILAAAGVSALLQASPAAFDALRYIGAAYLAFLALQMWRATPQTGPVDGAANTRRAFMRGFLTNILNPKVALFVLAFLPQFTDPANGPVWRQILVLGAIFLINGFFVSAATGALSGWLGERLRRGAGLLNKIAAIVFGGLAARLAIT